MAECSVCLEALDERARSLGCGHAFHGSCIDAWIRDTCPVCRTLVETTGDAVLDYIRKTVGFFGSSAFGVIRYRDHREVRVYQDEQLYFSVEDLEELLGEVPEVVRVVEGTDFVDDPTLRSMRIDDWYFLRWLDCCRLLSDSYRFRHEDSEDRKVRGKFKFLPDSTSMMWDCVVDDVYFACFWSITPGRKFVPMDSWTYPEPRA